VQRLGKERQRETALVVGELVGTTMAVGAAIVDQKLGKGQQYKVFDDTVPVTAIAGAVELAPAFFLGKSPILQAASVNGGMTLIKISLYRYLTGKIEAGE
jgi:hypothetical protein